jgi:RNA polymerase sigma factor for flagellar operon FliA
MIKKFFLIACFVWGSLGDVHADTASPLDCKNTLLKLSDRLWVRYREDPSAAHLESLLTIYRSWLVYLAKPLVRGATFGVSLDDLVQEAWIALAQEIPKFDPSLGFDFRTFAKKRIRGAMLDFISKNDPLTRPMRNGDKTVRIFRNQLQMELSRDPTDEEVLVELRKFFSENNEAEKIWNNHRLVGQFQSLDAAYDGSSALSAQRGQALAESLKDHRLQLPELELEREDSWKFLLQSLKPEVVEALRLVFIEGHNQNEVAARMGVDPSRVSQHLKEARKIFEKIGEPNVRAILYGEPVPDASVLESVRAQWVAPKSSAARFEEQLEAVNEFILRQKRWPSVGSRDPNEAKLARWVHKNGNRTKVFEMLKEEVKLVAPKN